MSLRTREARQHGEDGVLPAPRALRVDRSNLRVLLSGRGLLGRFTYLVATQVVTVLLGFVYWTVTARLIPAGQVGVAAAAISTGTFLAMIGVLGVSTVMLVALDAMNVRDRRAFVSTGLVAASASVLLLAVGTWALSPLLGPNLRALGANPLDGVLFVLGAVALTSGLVLDAAAIGLRRGPAQLIRNAVASALKVGLVLGCVVFAARTTTGLLLGWDAALVASLVVAPRLLRLRYRRASLKRRLDLVRRYTSLSMAHHVLNLAIGSVSYFLPVIAALVVVPKDMAYFSVAQLVSGSVLMLPFLLATTLFVESTGDEEALRRNIRRTFPIGLACCAAVLAVFEPGSGLVLSVFGPAYAAHGAIALHLILLGGLPYVVKDHFMAIRRAQNRLGEAARVGFVSTAVEVLAAAVGGVVAGLPGLCGAWALATFAEAAFFFMPVWRTIRSPRGRGEEEGGGQGADAEAAAAEAAAEASRKLALG